MIKSTFRTFRASVKPVFYTSCSLSSKYGRFFSIHVPILDSKSDHDNSPSNSSGRKNIIRKNESKKPNLTSCKVASKIHNYVFQGQEFSVDHSSPILALPLTQKPLFPGYYKVLTIKDPVVRKAIREIEHRKDAFVVTFLLKDDTADADIITDISQIHDIGTISLVTNAFDAVNGGLSVMLYPFSRVKLNRLLPANPNIDNFQNFEPIKPIGNNGHIIPQSSLNHQAINRRSNLTDITPETTAASIFSKYNVSKALTDPFLLKSYDKLDPQINALVSEVMRNYQLLWNLVGSGFNDTYSSTIAHVLRSDMENEHAFLADSAAAISQKACEETQQLLQSDDIKERLNLALTLLNNERVTIGLQKKISSEVEKKIQTRNKEYYLNEQLKGIKKELGIENDEKEKLTLKFKQRIEKLTLPTEAIDIFKEELSKLSASDPASSEYAVIRNYLEWISTLPWGQFTKDRYSINEAKSILDHDHYGMKDAKSRILEFIAVGQLKGSVQGKIICFVGPPGVGKTSIGKSIAQALGRKFYRFSVGGLSDVAEIKGHRRTYIGALPGKVVQLLKRVGSQNPLIMIDEIDKISKNALGDPGSALLELLDPEQNSAFIDHYLDTPIDLSNVLFICTANTIDTIPLPLLDRMEVIELSGYVIDEKVEIAEKFLIPSVKKEMGLENASVNISKDAIRELIKYYCRESGVRNLKKYIDKLFRKVSYNIVADQKESDLIEPSKQVTNEHINTEKVRNVTEKILKDFKLMIQPETLKEYVGPKVHLSDRLYENSPIGVVMGLAWTSSGGVALYTEAILEQTLASSTRPSFRKTGSLGDVMKESTDIAYSYSKSFIAKYFPENTFFEKANVHLHCPQGAVPKDGPSAGITIASALLSLALNKAIASTIAMTGELTLTGKILRIGGIKEKTIAAKSSGARMLLFPSDNQADWEELPNYIKDGITGIPISWYTQAFPILFPTIPLVHDPPAYERNESIITDNIELYHISPGKVDLPSRSNI